MEKASATISASFRYISCIAYWVVEKLTSKVLGSSTEIATTMICIGIPICRPLYKQYRDKLTSRDASKYQEQSDGRSHPLKTFGGSTLRPGQINKDDNSDGDSIKETERKLGIRGLFNKARAYAMHDERVCDDNQSDEQILGPEVCQSHQNDREALDKGIMVTYEVTTSRRDIESSHY